jgi:hypothetical protein
MMPSNSKETAEIAGQAHRFPMRGRQAERPSYNQKVEMALGLRWWSVQQSFVEGGQISAPSLAATVRAGLAVSSLAEGEIGQTLVRGGDDKAQSRKGER